MNYLDTQKNGTKTTYVETRLHFHNHKSEVCSPTYNINSSNTYENKIELHINMIDLEDSLHIPMLKTCQNAQKSNSSIYSNIFLSNVYPQAGNIAIVILASKPEIDHTALTVHRTISPIPCIISETLEKILCNGFLKQIILY